MAEISIVGSGIAGCAMRTGRLPPDRVRTVHPPPVMLRNGLPTQKRPAPDSVAGTYTTRWSAGIFSPPGRHGLLEAGENFSINGADSRITRSGDGWDPGEYPVRRGVQ